MIYVDKNGGVLSLRMATDPENNGGPDGTRTRDLRRDRPNPKTTL